MTARRARVLANLVDAPLPKEFVVSSDADAWPFVGTAMLSRAATSIRAISLLTEDGFNVDGSILTRSLYEHAVHFSWLAIDPSKERMELWRKEDLRSRIAADTDAISLGSPLLTEAARAEFERQKKAIGGKSDSLQALAKAADDYWVPLLPGLTSGDGFASFWGLYASIYRHYSKFAHPSQMGLNPVTIGELPLPELTVMAERDLGESRDTLGIAVVVFALMLLVASSSLGTPDEATIFKTFE